MKLIYPSYDNSILNVSNTILKHYGCDYKYSVIPELDRFLDTNLNHIVYVLLDGLGVNVIKKHLSKADGLYKYMEKEITSVFPPTTVAATNAVISGLPPITNGHLGWVQYFPEEDTNMIVFQNKDFYSGELQKDNLREKYLSYTRLCDQINKKNPHVIASEIMPEVVHKGGSTSFSNAVERVLTKVHNTDTSFTYLYWTEPDLTQHVYGPDAVETATVVTHLNKVFEDLIGNIPPQTAVIVIADHGLTNVTEIPLYDYPAITDLLIRKPSIEPRATNFFVQQDKLSEFKRNFEDVFDGKFKLYTKQEILNDLLFGEGPKHNMIDSFLGDFIAVAIDKYMFGLTTSKGYLGHHAGLSEDEMIVPLILYKKSD